LPRLSVYTCKRTRLCFSESVKKITLRYLQSEFILSDLPKMDFSDPHKPVRRTGSKIGCRNSLYQTIMTYDLRSLSRKRHFHWSESQISALHTILENNEDWRQAVDVAELKAGDTQKHRGKAKGFQLTQATLREFWDHERLRTVIYPPLGFARLHVDNDTQYQSKWPIVDRKICSKLWDVFQKRLSITPASLTAVVHMEEQPSSAPSISTRTDNASTNSNTYVSCTHTAHLGNAHLVAEKDIPEEISRPIRSSSDLASFYPCNELQNDKGCQDSHKHPDSSFKLSEQSQNLSCSSKPMIQSASLHTATLPPVSCQTNDFHHLAKLALTLHPHSKAAQTSLYPSGHSAASDQDATNKNSADPQALLKLKECEAELARLSVRKEELERELEERNMARYK